MISTKNASVFPLFSTVFLSGTTSTFYRPPSCKFEHGFLCCDVIDSFLFQDVGSFPIWRTSKIILFRFLLSTLPLFHFVIFQPSILLLFSSSPLLSSLFIPPPFLFVLNLCLVPSHPHSFHLDTYSLLSLSSSLDQYWATHHFGSSPAIFRAGHTFRTSRSRSSSIDSYSPRRRSTLPQPPPPSHLRLHGLRSPITHQAFATMAPPLKDFQEDPTVWQKCNLTFPTWDLYHQHKIRSGNHITCEVCSRDFKTLAAAKLHHDQVRLASVLNPRSHQLKSLTWCSFILSSKS